MRRAQSLRVIRRRRQPFISSVEQTLGVPPGGVELPAKCASHSRGVSSATFSAGWESIRRMTSTK